MQIFNNWSPHLVSDPDKVWIGLEYFCYDADPLWKGVDNRIVTTKRPTVAQDFGYSAKTNFA